VGLSEQPNKLACFNMPLPVRPTQPPAPSTITHQQLGPIERLALLLSQDTGARLSYVAAAVRPYVADLAARVSLKGALQQGGS